MNYYITFCGGETAGSAAKRPLITSTRRREVPAQIQAPKQDNISFKGGYYDYNEFNEEENCSLKENLLCALSLGALLAFGFCYTRSADLLGKIKNNGKIKQFIEKISLNSSKKI